MTELTEQTLRGRCVSLFRFLRDVTTLRSVPQRSVDEYEAVLWFDEVPDEPECDSIARRAPAGAEDEIDPRDQIWLEIDKPALRPPPEPPAALEPWLDPDSVGDCALEQPLLRDRLRIPDGDDVLERSLDTEPEVRASFRWYLHERWLPWALEQRRLVRVQRTYAALFAMQRKQERRGEELQVAFGLGLLVSNTDDARVRRHLVVADAAIEIDATSGRITVGPGLDGATPSLEQDMLDPTDRPPPGSVAELERAVRDLGDDVWQPDRIGEICARWVHAAAADGRYVDSMVPPRRGSRTPEVTLAPAILLRRRSDRSLLRAFDEILGQLEHDGRVPFGIARFVDVVSEHESFAEASKRLDRDFLPLPSNREQRLVLDRLRKQQGVLVQGPPGTGKSHTIANLICHLLATGKRVLVTSHTARALEVLRDKLPGNFSELCVMLLGAGRDALSSLEQSVHAITERQQTFDADASEARIAALELELDRSARRAAETLTELREIEECDTVEHRLEFDGVAFEGTSMCIAERLDRERAVHGWIEDPIDADRPFPLSDDQLAALGRIEPDRRVEDDSGRPVLPEPRGRVEEWFATERRYENREAAPEFTPLSLADRERVAASAAALVATLDRLHATDDEWIARAAADVVEGRERTWQQLRERTDAVLAESNGRRRVRITGIDRRPRERLESDAAALRAHLAAGSGFGFWIFRSAVVRRSRYIWEQVTVDGDLARTTAALDVLLAELDSDRRGDELSRAWSDIAGVAPPGTDSLREAWFADAREPLAAALSLGEHVREIERIASDVGGFRAPPLGTRDTAGDFAGSAAQARDAGRREAATTAIDRERARLADLDHDAAARAARALEDRDLVEYGRAVERIEALEELHSLRELVAAAGAPATAAALARQDRRPTEGLRPAWAHARARTFVTDRLDPRRERSLRDDLATLRDAERAATCELAEALAWHALLRDLGEHERQHLVAWSKAVRRVGKGTGKHAARHRRAAREHMEQCRTAIPCWVMPMYRVAESIRPGVDAFDVVIIDEASQSGPDALMLLYLTKQVIVVGDDKQISPDYVGLTRDDVELLRRRHLSELPHDDAFSLEHSLFDLAEIRYGNRVRLREHFRCMPEIIRFCNDLCYRTEPLIPLKQFGAGRLTPVIVTQHVPDGYRDGTESRVSNPPEASAIVDRIAACHEDPAYAGKTFGMISLQGRDQAQLVEGKLLERLGPDVVLERDLVCGDAYAFQGDERDVMFLSLVAAPSEDRRIGVLADQRSERRFNVAVSRAREQLWLFHTVRPDDLSPKCLRRTLLEYCLDPHAKVALPAGIDPASFASSTLDDRTAPPPEPFDSWFEVDVCREILARGFRVEPQVEVAGYRIDLVVVGSERRIAVECDGDAWHGADAFDADQARQRTLERCGWTFVRIRGSAFYLDRARALEPLWATLRDLAIGAPAASNDRSTGA